MTLTIKQIAELDNLKQNIERTETLIQRAQSDVEAARDIEDDAKVIDLEKAIEYGLDKIKQMVSIQSKSMKLEYNLILDLIFDREYTLSIIA